MLQLYTANILYLFLIHLKWHSSFFKLHQIFPKLMVQMLFSKIQQAPGPNFRKVGKFLNTLRISANTFDTYSLHIAVKCIHQPIFNHICSGVRAVFLKTVQTMS